MCAEKLEQPPDLNTVLTVAVPDVVSKRSVELWGVSGPINFAILEFVSPVPSTLATF